MEQKSDNFKIILEKHYGIKAESDDIFETYGSDFEKQRFRVDDSKYNLIHCTKNFPEQKELVSQMVNFEINSTVKSYELIEQSVPINDYYLYRLVPHTVQGIPSW